MKSAPHTIALLGLLLAGVSQSGAQTTDWGSSVAVDPITYDSTGTAAGGSMVWTIGWFNDGFIPDATNYNDWAANYNEVDRTTEQSYDLGGGLFAYSAAGHKDDGGAASYGKQAYIFVYNDLGLIGTSGGEALLFRENGFVFPDIPNQDTFDVADNPNDTKDDSFDVIWGRVDRDQYNAGGLEPGGGILSNPLLDTANASWEVQTATFIPEPSTALLGGLASFILLRRRRR